MQKVMWYFLILWSLLAVNSSFAATKAPDWELKNEAGEIIKLSDYEGKPLVIHFWATWCPFCKKLQPTLDKLFLQYKEQGLEMIAISWWEDEGATPQQVLEQRGHHFKTLIKGDEVAKTYGVRGTPMTFFINRKGEILYATNKSDPKNPKLESAIQSIIKPIS